MIEEGREATRGEIAISLRLSLDEPGPAGFSNAELRDLIAMHADPARPLGSGPWHLGGLLGDLAVRRRGRARGSGARHPRADPAPGGRRRPLHQCRCDGAPGPRRHPRLHRRRPTLDRRPVPAEEDRRGSLRRHPRMHRLQHLRLGRHDADDQPLHAEHRLHGGMAQGLAPRTGAREGGVDPRC